jgi:ABC-type transport system involved in cytochrome bd biosynthesis fused ATPase/permease subunit
VSGADRSYLARVVAARTGLSQADAEKRVNEVIAETKQAIDDTRRAAASFALWMAAAMLFGAFAASLAAVEGGQLRDGMWNEKRLVPRAI